MFHHGFHVLAIGVVLVAAACVRPDHAAANLTVTTVRTNHLDHPLGVPASSATFAWKLASSERAVTQVAWQVRLSPGAAVGATPSWDSGWVRSGDQIGIHYGGPALAHGERYAWQVRVTDNHGHVSAWSPVALFETDLDTSTAWRADWIAPARAGVASAVFRKDFTLATAPIRARLYATALGTYRLFLNGERTDDAYLAPGWTDYGKRIAYQTYDVTTQVHAGDNTLAAMLAPGWYAGHIASFGAHKYGDTPALSAQLRLDFADGSTTWVATDGSWSTTAGPFREADIIMGETYDAAALPANWNRVGAPAAGWNPAVVRPRIESSRLHAQDDAPVRVTSERPAGRLSRQPTPGSVIYDLGQNMVGVVTLTMNARAGQDVRLRYGEVLNPDGSLYTANLRTARATDHYLAATGGVQSYTPTFTYHGFRYVEITGLDAADDVRSITGLVLGSDLRWTGKLVVGDPMLTQLQSNITWGQRGNFLSIPTDTPARDERLGWAGDINVFAPTASFNQDTLSFLSKWLRDLRDAQAPNGDYPGVAPNPVGIESGAGWSDAGITVTHTLWTAYGDKRVIEDGYASMTRFMGFIEAQAGPSLRRVHGPWADWLHLDDPTPPDLIGTAYLAYDARLMSEMARAIGRDEDATRYAGLADRVTAAFVSRYVHADGTVGSGSQTGYALAIGMGLVSSLRVDDAFVRSVTAKHDHLSTGFIGTPWLLPALSFIGRDDLAYRLLLNRDYPSWGYEVSAGATTMWERWNSQAPDGSFGDVSMNSFNHYAYGAVGDWMYQNVAGIVPAAPGYRRIDIAPRPGGGITSGGGSLDSTYGTIATAWKVVGDRFELDVTVPVNTTAAVMLPVKETEAITEGDRPLREAAGVSGLTSTSVGTNVVIGSGHYVFRGTLLPLP